MGVADRANNKRGSEAYTESAGDRAKRPLETRTAGPKDMMREVRPERGGSAHGECVCSTLRVRGWWMLTMNSHGVEISIAGCVEEMVRDPNPISQGCPDIGVLPSTLTLRDSYTRIT